MIERGQATSGRRSHIEWHVGDAASLPLPDDSYDVVLCQMGLMFMEDRSQPRSPRCAACWRPAGGSSSTRRAPSNRVFELMEQAIVEHISPDLGGFVRAVFSMHDPDAVAALLRDAGLDDVSATVSTATLRLPAPGRRSCSSVSGSRTARGTAQAPGGGASRPTPSRRPRRVLRRATAWRPRRGRAWRRRRARSHRARN